MTSNVNYGENLIVNGDFENNFLNNKGWGQRTSIEGWTATQDKIEVQEQNYQTGNVRGNAVVELDGVGNATIEQNVHLAEAGVYAFSVDYAMRGTNADTNGFAVYVNGVLVQEIYPTESGFQTLELELDLEAGDTKIELKGLGDSDCIGTVVDNVSLRQVQDSWVLDKDDCTYTVEAEHMHRDDFKVVSGSQASGGKLVKFESGKNDAELSTDFGGTSGTYNLTVRAQDETDGKSMIKVYVNGSFKATIKLDQQTNGGGSNNSGFTDFTIEGLQLELGDEIELRAWRDGGEWVRIDNLTFEQVKFEECDEPGAVKIDFEGFNAGTVVNTQYDGVMISAQRNKNNTAENDAMVFDTENVTGGDSDLASTTQGNVLIVSEDNDSSDPDDAVGGTIWFKFDEPAFIHDLKILDAEEGGKIRLLDENGTLIEEVVIPNGIDGGLQQIMIGVDGVAQIDLTLNGSGAVDDLCYVPGQPAQGSIAGRYFCDVDGNDVDNGEPGVANATVWLLLEGVGRIMSTTTDANGNYEFTGLDAGSYRVRFEDPNDVDGVEGKEFVAADQGTDDTIDSDVTIVGGAGNGNTDYFDLAQGEDKTDVDAGIVDPGTAAITGRYFCDENDNDVDDGEPGIAGATVTLLGADGNPVLDAAGNAVTTTTDSDGNYAFTGLTAGTYAVLFAADAAGKTFVAQDDPDGNGDDTNDSDVDATTGQTGPITVAIGETSEDNDAGVEDPGTASVGNKVWLDANGNGTFDAGEDGVNGVEVTLTGAGADDVIGTADDTTQTTTTSGDGDYLFTDLDAGKYKVTFNESTTGGLVFTTEGAAAADAVDNDSDAGAGGMTDEFTLDIGEAERDIDAGLVDPGTAAIEGRYFCDENDNDVDDGEPGIAGVTVALIGADGNPVLDGAGNAVTATTDANGNYAFTGLAAGTYAVLFPADAAGKTFVAQDDPNGNGDDTTDSDVDPDTGLTGPITVAIGETSSDNDAGVEDPGTAAIEGRVFCDENDNSLDDGEPGVANVTVTLLNADGSSTGLSTVTDDDGNYSFTGLDAGSYIVDFDEGDTDLEGKVLVTQDVDGNANDTDDSDASEANGQTGVITVAIGETSSDNDAGVEDPGTAEVGNLVFFDNNDNGVFDAGDTAAADVEVKLFEDTTGDGVADTQVGAAQTTDANGNYLFTGLNAGTYAVMFGTVAGFGLTTASADAPDAVNNDSDADILSGMTDEFVLSIGESELDIDAGLVSLNQAPMPADDAAMVCADETLTVDVLDNDVDPEGDALTITAVDGQAISEGQTITTGAGTFVTLSGGQLVVDGAAAYDSFDIGETALENISYTVTDSEGNVSDPATLAMTFCGDANTAESLDAAISGTVVTFSIDDLAQASDFIDGYTLNLLSSTNADIELGTYTASYCLDLTQLIDLDTVTTATVSVLTEANLAAVAPTANADKFDSINWLLNNDQTLVDNGDGTSDNYTDAEVQEAIWLLMNETTGFLNQLNFPAFNDNDNGVRDGFEVATLQNAQEIAMTAMLQGDGFVAGDGQVIGLILDPNDPASQDQPFVIGVNFDDIDCIC